MHIYIYTDKPTTKGMEQRKTYAWKGENAFALYLQLRVQVPAPLLRRTSFLGIRTIMDLTQNTSEKDTSPFPCGFLQDPKRFYRPVFREFFSARSRYYER